MPQSDVASVTMPLPQICVAGKQKEELDDRGILEFTNILYLGLALSIHVTYSPLPPSGSAVNMWARIYKHASITVSTPLFFLSFHCEDLRHLIMSSEVRSVELTLANVSENDLPWRSVH